MPPCSILQTCMLVPPNNYEIPFTFWREWATKLAIVATTTNFESHSAEPVLHARFELHIGSQKSRFLLAAVYSTHGGLS